MGNRELLLREGIVANDDADATDRTNVFGHVGADRNGLTLLEGSDKFRFELNDVFVAWATVGHGLPAEENTRARGQKKQGG